MISQYQELKCGRGRAEDDLNDRVSYKKEKHSMQFEFNLRVFKVHLSTSSSRYTLKSIQVLIFSSQIPNIHYSTQPTATSYLSTTRKPLAYTEAKPTPTQSPTGTGPQSLAAEEPSPNIMNRGPRKSVKFPDSPTANGRQLLDPWSMDMTMLLARNSISEN